MTENEFILQDRIMKIQAINEQYDLENNGYLSFSGGKDSVVLHYLLDMALPNNNIPRLFLNTGIEYLDMVKFVRTLADNDNRIVIFNSGVNIPLMLNKYGYPFKSKEHSHILHLWQNNNDSKVGKQYLTKDGNRYKTCPKCLEYQFTKDFDINISDKCCYKLKKEIAKKWEKQNNKIVCMTGMRKSEGGERTNISCIVTDKDNNLKKFHPLSVITNDWESWFIDNYNIKLCKLYYSPFNFDRTGCRGCPFSLNLQHDLDIMQEFLPLDFKVANKIWKPVYDEYKRIGFRLRKEDKNQMTIWEVEGEKS